VHTSTLGSQRGPQETLPTLRKRSLLALWVRQRFTWGLRAFRRIDVENLPSLFTGVPHLCLPSDRWFSVPERPIIIRESTMSIEKGSMSAARPGV
jgi:hypothetical protein